LRSISSDVARCGERSRRHARAQQVAAYDAIETASQQAPRELRHLTHPAFVERHVGLLQNARGVAVSLTMTYEQDRHAEKTWNDAERFGCPTGRILLIFPKRYSPAKAGVRHHHEPGCGNRPLHQKLFGYSELILGSYTTIRVGRPKF
jgi:hypothetical protein